MSTFRNELKKWEKELQSIRGDLNDAEEMQIMQEAVKSWLFDQRVLAFDMEVILDEFAYELMGRKLMRAESEKSSEYKKCKFFPTFSTNPSHYVRNVQMRSEVIELTVRLQDVSARKGGLDLEKMTGAAATSACQRSLPPTPIAHEPGVYGSDEDKKLFLEFLRTGKGGQDDARAGGLQR